MYDCTEQWCVGFVLLKYILHDIVCVVIYFQYPFFCAFIQLAGVGVASKPLPSDKSKVGADTEDLEARLRQLHN